MKNYVWNDEWTVKHFGSEEQERKVTLPHDAMLEEPRTEYAVGGINVGWFEGRDYLYSKRFFVPQEAKEETWILEFEGVYHDAEVFINGRPAASRPYGYSNFYVPMNDFLRYGAENLVEVSAKNADQPNSRWYSGAGIYRPVTLWKAGKKHIQLNGVKITTVSIGNPAIVEIDVFTNGTGTVKVALYDGGALIGASEGSTEQEPGGMGIYRCRVELSGAKLWNVETPYLYRCLVNFEDDSAEESFGIRTLTWGDDGLKINGERVILRGACIHHDNGPLGAATYADAEKRRIRILKENGYNAVRSAHNPCSKALLDACDRQGMLMMDELVDCWYIHKTEYDYVNHFEQWWQRDLYDMVEKDYNHPSVILYSTGNEVSETAQKQGIALTGRMTEFLHSLDATRPVTCGVNIFFNFLSSIGFGVYSDKKSEREVAQAKKREKNGKKKAVGSEFFNNLAGLLGDDAMKIGATLPPCDWKTKDAFEKMDIAGYNYGIYRYRHDLKKYPHRLILGSETFCKDAHAFYELAKKEPRIIGDFVWAGMDYLGEVGVGSWEYKDYAPEFEHGPGWITAGSGRIDLIGNPLAEAFYTKTAFGLMNHPVIAVRPVNHTGEKHSPSAWKMTNAKVSWSWNGCEGKKALVEVYSSSYFVELFINGISHGKKRLKHCRTMFSITYEAGRIEAVAYDKEGRETGRQSIKSASEQTELRLLPEQEKVRKGGLAFIQMKYTDEEGILKVLERGDIKVEVNGGKLLALGNGCPFNKTGYLENHTETWFGEALAIVLAQEREVVVRATDGIQKAEVKLSVNGE